MTNQVGQPTTPEVADEASTEASETATGSITTLLPDSVTGTGVVPGIAYAPVVWKQGRPETLPHEPDVAQEDRAQEAAHLETAVETVAARLEDRASQVTGVASNVLSATAALARDRGWKRAALKLVKGGTPAPQAVVAAIAQFITTFEKLGGLMAERTTDLRDIRDRVIAELLGLPEPGVPTPAQPSVLFADDLAPADTAGLDPSVITALVTQLGGPTSHTAIIARQLAIPCIVAASKIGKIADGTRVLVDGGAGTIQLGIDEQEGARLVAEDAARREAIRSWRGPATTKDGRDVELLANVQDGAGARKAAESQARGVGLFRTELCFLNSEDEPSIEEQTGIYSEVFAAFAGHKVVVRTLDAGSDKPLKFANMEHEENPALGVRGVRIGLRDIELLTNQLDAVAAAAAARDEDAETPAWVMAPMVATIPEAKRFAQLARERGIKPGIMVEVPSVALLAPAFLEHVDFLSIGTNDLSQYTMAADRMSPHLATLTDPWQPAVLTLIAMTARAGADADKPVGVCGEAAADPLLACVLIGLGVTSLSMAASAVSGVGAQLAAVTFAQCQEAAEAVLSASDSASARERARTILG
ncbi:phosphotransferase system enzyme I (PtsI) [Kineosphaera limosa]|uniref:Phosphoenolpyruvate-protein phosphotransferase n=1 Tax=Kineosphaera limosa NBRC 100340 TaxID=1184609 RepID=K6WDZ6_9MICO|nr:phosphoenolpyruvate--protein phosphotransferase [Kineosphaera limosa]NYE00125.1 phosphotransferase system enzyme I (PtsI) [Kineosphaera limosa]GAB97520.1 phosphoenolpyruvate--protein phosphotransferase [Kineosphaera limosa NBRC 100340]